MSGLFGSTTIKGTRITDFAQTSAEVGKPIPFGYGRFPVDGNVIWAHLPPIEVRRVEDVGGKGGGTKQETFVYITNYAIAFCLGPIYGFWTIKRNGKVVYSTDPNAPVEDHDYSQKWLERATLYYGSMNQLPDSTIESFEGSGKVSAFHGLAYIVIEGEETPDGAIAQYEAVPIATPPEAYLTSKPYAQYFEAAAGTGASIGGITLRQLLIDAESAPDSSAASLVPVGGGLVSILFDADQDADNSAASLVPVGGSLRVALLLVTQQSDNSGASLTPISGALGDIPVGKQATDNSGASLTPVGGSLRT